MGLGVRQVDRPHVGPRAIPAASPFVGITATFRENNFPGWETLR